MTNATEQPPWLRLDAAMFAGGALALAGVLGLSVALAHDPGDVLTRNTVRLSLAWYAAALLLMLSRDPHDWQAATFRGRLARWCWTWGIVSFLVHLAMAFHFYHHWSHAHAFEHTRQVSGLGEGIYFSYLFTWLWIGDAVWWWASPRSYATRRPWIDRGLHAYMLFLVFNGTIVFESGAIRWAGLVGFAVLTAAWLATRAMPRLRPA